jgi:hypothetical protein
MSKYLYESEFKNKTAEVRIKLLLFHFEDENSIHFIYSPHLDLTGYGHTFEEAKKSFQIVLDDFLDYTYKNKTLKKTLSDLGWDINMNDNSGIILPGITSVIKDNQYISELFDKYSITTYHQEISLALN